MRPLVDILDNEKYLFRLNEVTFERVNGEEEEDIELVVDDSFEISERQEDMFGVKLIRRVHFVPAAIFDIRVEFEVGRLVSEDAEEKLQEYDLEEIINSENVDSITGYNFNRVSAIITSLTSSFEMSPLITPPIFVK